MSTGCGDSRCQDDGCLKSRPIRCLEVYLPLPGRATQRLLGAARHLPLVVVMLVGSTVPAHACDQEILTRIIGFSREGNIVILHREEEPIRGTGAVQIHLFDLRSSKPVKTYDVVTQKESWMAVDHMRGYTANDLKKLRARRWSTIKAELMKEGFRIEPEYAALQEKKADHPFLPHFVSTEIDAEFWLEKVVREEEPINDYDLVAARGSRRVTLRRALYQHQGSFNDFPAIGRMYLGPAKRYLIAVGNGVCHEPQVWVVPVEEIERLLRQGAREH